MTSGSKSLLILLLKVMTPISISCHVNFLIFLPDYFIFLEKKDEADANNSKTDDKIEIIASITNTPPILDFL